MSRLSKEALSILKPTKKGYQITKAPMKLLVELSEIGQSILTKAQSPFSKWKLSCDQKENSDDHFSCTLTTLHPHSEEILLKLHIDADGDSYIEAGINDDLSENHLVQGEIKRFMDSPAGKRYFTLNNNKVSIIKAKIPNKEIFSRYFEEYMTHLINHMDPFLRAIGAYGPNQNLAL